MHIHIIRGFSEVPGSGSDRRATLAIVLEVAGTIFFGGIMLSENVAMVKFCVRSIIGRGSYYRTGNRNLHKTWNPNLELIIKNIFNMCEMLLLKSTSLSLIFIKIFLL